MKISKHRIFNLFQNDDYYQTDNSTYIHIYMYVYTILFIGTRFDAKSLTPQRFISGLLLNRHDAIYKGS